MIKIFLILICSFTIISSTFAQTDTTKIPKEAIERLQSVVAQLQKDVEYMESGKKASKLVAINMATASTMGKFPSDLLQGTTTLKNTYLWRVYVDIKFKEPFILFVELQEGKSIVINKKDKKNMKKNKELFFKKILTFLTNIDTAQDIKADMQELMKQTLKDCEKYKDCEHCWLITQCE